MMKVTNWKDFNWEIQNSKICRDIFWVFRNALCVKAMQTIQRKIMMPNSLHCGQAWILEACSDKGPNNTFRVRYFIPTAGIISIVTFKIYSRTTNRLSCLLRMCPLPTFVLRLLAKLCVYWILDYEKDMRSQAKSVSFTQYQTNWVHAQHKCSLLFFVWLPIYAHVHSVFFISGAGQGVERRAGERFVPARGARAAPRHHDAYAVRILTFLPFIVTWSYFSVFSTCVSTSHRIHIRVRCLKIIKIMAQNLKSLKIVAPSFVFVSLFS